MLRYFSENFKLLFQNIYYNESTKYEIPFVGNITSENKKLFEKFNETNLKKIVNIVLGKDNNILNKAIKSGIIQNIKNKNYTKKNILIP